MDEGLSRVRVTQHAGTDQVDDGIRPLEVAKGNGLRLGGKVRGWVLLNEVRLGYEIWRQLNYFPPEPTVAADPRGGSGEASTK